MSLVLAADVLNATTDEVRLTLPSPDEWAMPPPLPPASLLTTVTFWSVIGLIWPCPTEPWIRIPPPSPPGAWLPATVVLRSTMPLAYGWPRVYRPPPPVAPVLPEMVLFSIRAVLLAWRKIPP